MKTMNSGNAKKVKVSYTNPLGMTVTVKKTMTIPELKEDLQEKRVSLNKISA